MNISNIPPTLFSSEDNRKRIESISNINTERLLENVKKATTIDTDKMIESFKIATTIDTDKLVESVKLAPKISEIISRNDINEILNKVFQQHNFSETIQKSVLHKVSNTEIRFDEPTQEYKIKPMIESEKETVKDYSHIYDFAIKLNEKIVFEMYPFLDSIPSEYVAYIYSIHLLIASLLGEAKHRNQSKLK